MVKGNLSGTIGGAIVLGVSAIGSVILAVVFLCCLKNNNVNSNDNQQRSTANQRHHKQNRHQNPNRQIRTEQNSSHEVIMMSGVHKHDNHSSHQQQQQQQHSNEYDPKKFSPPIQSNGLVDSTNSGYGKQLPQSPSKTSSFAYLNQSNGSTNNQSPINSNAKRNNYNRH